MQSLFRRVYNFVVSMATTSRVDTSVKNVDASGRGRIFRALANAIQERISFSHENMIVVEIGDGTGLVTLQFYRYVKKIIAVKPSEAMLGVLKEKLDRLNITNVELLHHDIEHAPFQVQENAVHVILSSMTWHSLKNPEGMMHTCYHLLVERGYLVIADLENAQTSIHEYPQEIQDVTSEKDRIHEHCVNAGFRFVRTEPLVTYTKKRGDGMEQECAVFLLVAQK